MRKGTCVHFTGCRDRTSACKVGIVYNEAFNTPPSPGMFLRMPCVNFTTRFGKGDLVPLDRGEHSAMPCDQYQEPSEQELAQYEAEREASHQRLVAGLKVAGAWRVMPKPQTDRTEVVECPICAGRLHLFQSSYNGHVHGHCETHGCLRWME